MNVRRMAPMLLACLLLASCAQPDQAISAVGASPTASTGSDLDIYRPIDKAFFERYAISKDSELMLAPLSGSLAEAVKAHTTVVLAELATVRPGRKVHDIYAVDFVLADVEVLAGEAPATPYVVEVLVGSQPVTTASFAEVNAALPHSRMIWFLTWMGSAPELKPGAGASFKEIADPTRYRFEPRLLFVQGAEHVVAALAPPSSTGSMQAHGESFSTMTELTGYLRSTAPR